MDTWGWKLTEEQKAARKKAKEIRDRRKHLKAIIASLKGELRVAENDLYLLQNECCEHPKAKHRCVGGISCIDCDDCGYSHP